MVTERAATERVGCGTADRRRLRGVWRIQAKQRQQGQPQTPEGVRQTAQAGRLHLYCTVYLQDSTVRPRWSTLASHRPYMHGVDACMCSAATCRAPQRPATHAKLRSQRSAFIRRPPRQNCLLS